MSEVCERPLTRAERRDLKAEYRRLTFNKQVFVAQMMVPLIGALVSLIVYAKGGFVYLTRHQQALVAYVVLGVGAFWTLFAWGLARLIGPPMPDCDASVKRRQQIKKDIAGGVAVEEVFTTTRSASLTDASGREVAALVEVGPGQVMVLSTALMRGCGYHGIPSRIRLGRTPHAGDQFPPVFSGDSVPALCTIGRDDLKATLDWPLYPTVFNRPFDGLVRQATRPSTEG